MRGLHRIYWVLVGMLPVAGLGGLLGYNFGIWGVVGATILGSLYGNVAVTWAYTSRETDR